MESGRIKNTDDIRKFILAGNATFTLMNPETSERMTYKVYHPYEDGPHFVRFLNGPDNENSFSYLGTIFNNQNFKLTKKSPDADSKAAKGFCWLWIRQGIGSDLDDRIHFYHEGRCGRCGRKLTVPESVKNGFGPECIQHIRG